MPRLGIRIRAVAVALIVGCVALILGLAVLPANPAAAAPAGQCLSVDDPSVYTEQSPKAGAIYRLYCASFLRTPDDEGFRYWLAKAETTSLGEIAASFQGGVEFRNRYGNRSDAQFVDLVYGNVMDRTPDSAGRNYWVGLLSGTIDRGRMMVYFSDSLEYRYRTSTDVWFGNCTDVRAVGADPIRRGRPGYGPHLDRDADGIACES